MKKLFAIAAMAAMLFACGEDEKKPTPGPGPDDEPVFESLITVDGNFSDWATLDASKVAVAELPALPVKYDGLTVVKAYADEMFLNIYFEFNDEVITDRVWTVFHCYINTDGDETTGGGDDEHTPNCSDYMLEGGFISEGAFCSYDPAVFPWGGEAGTTGWEWHPVGVPGDEEHNWGAIITEGNGVASGAGAGNAYEIQIVREMVPTSWADTFTIGFDVSDNWTTVGVLPLLTATDENPNGTCAQLSVTIDK